jgi:hypothetical protein
MMATFKRYQGDSLWMDIDCAVWQDIDPVWPDWSGVWVIDQTGLSGDLSRSLIEGTFLLRIGPATVPGWNELPAGTHIITIQIEAPAVDYRYEETHKLMIKAQNKPDA